MQGSPEENQGRNFARLIPSREERHLAQSPALVVFDEVRLVDDRPMAVHGRRDRLPRGHCPTRKRARRGGRVEHLRSLPAYAHRVRHDDRIHRRLRPGLRRGRERPPQVQHRRRRARIPGDLQRLLAEQAERLAPLRLLLCLLRRLRARRPRHRDALL
ncbi:hypothetical protein BD311DRAFT_748653 [Dichomitus squalens]|uniref:Uncharacterized protein n=1 Tax=Dichomitus squalens TaxID=114155 RepID=A0A4Q9N062_9APHY|nr:hypothetical protein BD311DRAFT_748653 [Dichomitus squalens]